MTYPDHETYRALYLRYFARDVVEIIDRLEPIRDTRVLDLCGGGGELSVAALTKGAREVILVDAEAAMIPLELRLQRHPNIFTVVTHAENFLHKVSFEKKTFDRIACRQAVNYWLTERTAKLLPKVLNPGGIFVFNTFNQKPPEKPRVLQYELAGHTFVEVSWLVGTMVHHLQARDGIAPHQTVFRWLPPERLRSLLKPHFVVVEEQHDKMSLYRCVKK